MRNRIIGLEEMTAICGFFTTDTTVNNAYGCKHPEQEETDEDFRTGKEHGKCYSFCCPLAYEANLEDMKELDKELYDDWKDEEYDPSEMGGEYMVVDVDFGKDKTVNS